MKVPQYCPKCGAELPEDAPAGICPRCLVAAGFESEAGRLANHPKSNPQAPTIDSPSPGTGFLPPTPAQLADKFPQLEILELLGHGGMGAVYKARQTNLDRLVALKIIRPEATHDPTFAERFNREAKTLARLSHQHIVAVHDFGEVEYYEAEDRPARLLYYFLMEYVDGANLRQLMRTGELAPEQALAIVPQICDALQFAHDEGVVHRDIKPENILVDKRGRVKIADFGLAKLANGSAAEFTLTGTHQVMGTLRYMAPEQMEGSHTVDHRADIYSLGVVFYEMLTGEAPVGHFEPPSKKVQVDVRLDDVVLRSLASKPERRYQHASEVKTDLESISSTFSSQSARFPLDPIEAINPDIEAARQRVQWPGIGLMIVGVFSLVLVLMSGSTFYWLTASPDSHLSANDALERAKDVGSTLLAIAAALALAIIVGAWKMLRLTSPRWAIAAAVLALLPLPAGPLWLVSLPIGIWALVVLSKPEVKRGFKLQTQWTTRKQEVPSVAGKVDPDEQQREAKTAGRASPPLASGY